MDKPLKILMLVAWEVEKADQDDLSKLSADIFVKKQGYWFLKYWPRKEDMIEVRGLNRSRLLRFIEQRLLKFYLFHSLWYVLRAIRYDLILCFHSQIGLPLAFLFNLFQIDRPIILFDVEGIGRKSLWATRWLIRMALNKVALIFYFASVQLKDYEMNYPDLLPRCRFVPLGIDPNRFRQPASAPENYMVAVGYQGRCFRDWKTLLQAYEKLKTDVPLMIVGKKSFTRNDIEDVNLPKNVQFAGKVSFSKLNEIVGKSRFVILPLPERRHSYGCITLLGAQALEKTVLTASVSGVTDYIVNEKTGFFYKDGDAEDLARKMSFLIRNPDLLNCVGRSARKSIERQFSESNMGRSISEETIKYFTQNSIGYKTFRPALRQQEREEQILLIGYNFFPFLGTGDKNFWKDLAFELAKRDIKIIVISITKNPEHMEVVNENLQIDYIKRPFHKVRQMTTDSAYHFHRHNHLWESLEKIVTLERVRKEIKRICQVYRVKHIHFMDDFGPYLFRIKKSFPDIELSTTLITFNIHSLIKGAYCLYKKTAVRANDVVVLTSDSFRRVIQLNNRVKTHLITIPWGVIPAEPIGAKVRDRQEVLKKMGVEENGIKSIILWSGFLQQIKEHELNLSLEFISRVAPRRQDVLFLFCIKPENFKQEFLLFQQVNIKILKTEPSEFQNLLSTSNLFFSPLWGKPCIGGPPLTWIESMNHGVPVVTTHEEGIEDIIEDRQNGFLFKTPEDFEEILTLSVDQGFIQCISEKARQTVLERFNINRIAEAYMRLWNIHG